jgi:hypothetical protein
MQTWDKKLKQLPAFLSLPLLQWSKVCLWYNPIDYLRTAIVYAYGSPP